MAYDHAFVDEDQGLARVNEADPTHPATLAPPSLGVCVRDVSKQFARFPALNGVSLDVQPGELLALLGPSGSGKTTLLRVIAGLDFPDAGQVLFDGKDMTSVSAAARGIGFVFQQYALFRHMSVAKNIAFGLDVKRRGQRPAKAAIMARVQELLDLVELPGLGARYPAALSGGQRQRVALARALAPSPRVLLLDEPFGALDAQVRKSLRRELRRIHEATGVTTIFVTHDQEEALELADRVAVLNQGRVEQVGSPADVLARPASAFVAGFVGEANRIEGRAASGVFAGAGLTLPATIADGPAVAFIRPEQFVSGEGGVAVRVERVSVGGPVVRLDCVTADGERWQAALARTPGLSISAGDTLTLRAAEGAVFAAPI